MKPANAGSIVVVGGGLAGLSASLEAVRYAAIHNGHVRVLLLDKAAALGGNSAKASSGLSALNTSSGDTEKSFVADTLKAGGGLSDEHLVRKLVVSASTVRGQPRGRLPQPRVPRLSSPRSLAQPPHPLLQRESSNALAFLEGFGVDISKLSQCGAHSVPRTRRNQAGGPNVGTAIVRALIGAAEQEHAINIVKGARVLELLTDSGGVRGIAYETSAELSERKGKQGGEEAACASGSVEAEAGAVVLATGGFAASGDKLARWAPALRSLPTTNGEGATGDGVLLGMRAGASAVDLEHVQVRARRKGGCAAGGRPPTNLRHAVPPNLRRAQVHPTAIVDPARPEARSKWLAPEALRGSGGVLLGPDGRRFVDELQARSAVTQAMLGLPSNGRAMLILGQVAADLFGPSTLAFYAGKGLALAHDGFGALARHLRVPEAMLREEAAAYDAAAAKGVDAFGKTVFPSPFGQRAEDATPDGGPFHSLAVTPALHYCMGGLKIGQDGEVLRELEEPAADGRARFAPIPGLFAAGEVTGGVHGKDRLAGNSLLECVVFGRAAARAAVDAVLGRASGSTA